MPLPSDSQYKILSRASGFPAGTSLPSGDFPGTGRSFPVEAVRYRFDSCRPALGPVPGTPQAVLLPAQYHPAMLVLPPPSTELLSHLVRCSVRGPARDFPEPESLLASPDSQTALPLSVCKASTRAHADL